MCPLGCHTRHADVCLGIIFKRLSANEADYFREHFICSTVKKIIKYFYLVSSVQLTIIRRAMQEYVKISFISMY